MFFDCFDVYQSVYHFYTEGKHAHDGGLEHEKTYYLNNFVFVPLILQLCAVSMLTFCPRKKKKT